MSENISGYQNWEGNLAKDTDKHPNKAELPTNIHAQISTVPVAENTALLIICVKNSYG